MRKIRAPSGCLRRWAFAPDRSSQARAHPLNHMIGPLSRFSPGASPPPQRSLIQRPRRGSPWPPGAPGPWSSLEIFSLKGYSSVFWGHSALSAQELLPWKTNWAARISSLAEKRYQQAIFTEREKKIYIKELCPAFEPMPIDQGQGLIFSPGASR